MRLNKGEQKRVQIVQQLGAIHSKQLLLFDCRESEHRSLQSSFTMTAPIGHGCCCLYDLEETLKAQNSWMCSMTPWPTYFTTRCFIYFTSSPGHPDLEVPPEWWWMELTAHPLWKVSRLPEDENQTEFWYLKNLKLTCCMEKSEHLSLILNKIPWKLIKNGNMAAPSEKAFETQP